MTAYRLSISIWPDNTSGIRAGKWSLLINCVDLKSDGVIQAWVEKGQKNYITFENYVSDDTTITIPGTANTVVCVSSVKCSKPYIFSTFSSKGPTRDGRRKPDISAPGECISAAKCCTQNGTIPLNGTSMAAPHVTGAIALLLSFKSKGNPGVAPTASQVRSALRDTTQNYNGNYCPELGYGVLDAESFFNSL